QGDGPQPVFSVAYLGPAYEIHESQPARGSIEDPQSLSRVASLEHAEGPRLNVCGLDIIRFYCEFCSIWSINSSSSDLASNCERGFWQSCSMRNAWQTLACRVVGATQGNDLLSHRRPTKCSHNSHCMYYGFTSA